MMLFCITRNIIIIKIEYVFFITFFLSPYQSPSDIGSFCFLKNIYIHAINLIFYDINSLVYQPNIIIKPTISDSSSMRSPASFQEFPFCVVFTSFFFASFSCPISIRLFYLLKPIEIF